MINYVEAQIRSISVHYVGSVIEQEGIKSTQRSIVPSDPALESMLLNYFFKNAKNPEYSTFSYPNGDLVMNPVFNIVNNIFDDPDSLHEQSVHIAKHLYERSNYPNIRPGELFIGYIHAVLVDDEMVDAIVIFKSEGKDSFIQIDPIATGFDLTPHNGISPSKVDKGCIIFNTEQEDGYKLSIIDKGGKVEAARYWTDDFLKIAPRPDNYHQTKDHITLTEAFIKERLKPLHEIDKTEEADILNRSHKYFKGNETYDDQGYENKVFQEEQTIAEFKEYKKDFQEERKIELEESFPISLDAVKKQAKIFKSVLKLDKNFHIYIHGDRSKIRKGVDEEGNKFYQVYYDSEQ